MIDTCPTWPTLLAWIENDLPDEEAQLLNTHVADCEECREKLALMNAVQEAGEVGTQQASPPAQWPANREGFTGWGVATAPPAAPAGSV